MVTQKQLFADVLQNFAIFTGKHLCWNFLLKNLEAWSPATLLKKDSNIGVFSQNTSGGCFQQQTNKDHCKEELVDRLCFLNMTLAVGHKVVLIPDYLPSTFHIFVFPQVLIEALISTSNSKNVLSNWNCFNQNCEIHKIHKTQPKLCLFIRTSANFLCFQHYKRHLKTSSH